MGADVSRVEESDVSFHQLFLLEIVFPNLVSRYNDVVAGLYPWIYVIQIQFKT